MANLPHTAHPSLRSYLTDEPGLTVITGAIGSGKTTVLHNASKTYAQRTGRHVLHSGGLAALSDLPGVAIMRAIRAHVPLTDLALATEAVRARLGKGALVIDDMHWLDTYSWNIVLELARHVPVLGALRMPAKLDTHIQQRLDTTARAWIRLTPLDQEQSKQLLAHIAPHLPPATITQIAAVAGGLPLVLKTLAINAAVSTSNRPSTQAHILEYAIADTITALHRPARTAIAVLGLLGRPATKELLGSGWQQLCNLGLAYETTDRPALIAPQSSYVAQVAAALLPASERQQLRRHLAELANTGMVSLGESARQLAAAGDRKGAHRAALTAAQHAATVGDRASQLLFAVTQTTTPTLELLYQTAATALETGHLASAEHILEKISQTQNNHDLELLMLQGEIALQRGEPTQAATINQALLATLPQQTHLPPKQFTEAIRIAILAGLLAGHTHSIEPLLSLSPQPAPPAVVIAEALAATHTQQRGWQEKLIHAIDLAQQTGRSLDQWWCGWHLVTSLAHQGHLSPAIAHCRDLAAACAQQGVYGWQMRFQAVELWCVALAGTDLDAVIAQSTDLTDRALPVQARAYVLAALCLALADTGALATARNLVNNQLVPQVLPGLNPQEILLTRWIGAEIGWLDGQAHQALQQAIIPFTSNTPEAVSLIEGLMLITNQWAAFDHPSLSPGEVAAVTKRGPTPITQTLSAWRTTPMSSQKAAQLFLAAANSWETSVLREQIRCLLAVGIGQRGQTSSSSIGLQALLAAEDKAQQAGMVLLLARIQRALRAYSIYRPAATSKPSSGLTAREHQILELVGAGEPTRRIAGRLGISRETVETHVRSGVRKLGARTRTEAAAIALSQPAFQEHP